MPITINGTGTITGISAGGLPDDSITTADIAANAVTYAKLGTTEQGQLCKAWVNFNGTGVVAIRAQYNVSSITDNGTGNYTINFTNALADANYSALISHNEELSYAQAVQTVTFAAGSYRFSTMEYSTGAIDPLYVVAAIFR